MRDVAILAAALGFVFGVVAGMSITLHARPIIEGAKTYLVLTPTCSVIGPEPPEWREARHAREQGRIR